jgi:hypothetical protein
LRGSVVARISGPSATIGCITMSTPIRVSSVICGGVIRGLSRPIPSRRRLRTRESWFRISALRRAMVPNVDGESGEGLYTSACDRRVGSARGNKRRRLRVLGITGGAIGNECCRRGVIGGSRSVRGTRRDKDSGGRDGFSNCLNRRLAIRIGAIRGVCRAGGKDSDKDSSGNFLVTGGRRIRRSIRGGVSRTQGRLDSGVSENSSALHMWEHRGERQQGMGYQWTYPYSGAWADVKLKRLLAASGPRRGARMAGDSFSCNSERGDSGATREVREGQLQTDGQQKE